MYHASAFYVHPILKFWYKAYIVVSRLTCEAEGGARFTSLVHVQFGAGTWSDGAQRYPVFAVGKRADKNRTW